MTQGIWGEICFHLAYTMDFPWFPSILVTWIVSFNSPLVDFDRPIMQPESPEENAIRAGPQIGTRKVHGHVIRGIHFLTKKPAKKPQPQKRYIK